MRAVVSDRAGQHVTFIPARVTRDIWGKVGVAFVFGGSSEKADVVHLIYGRSEDLRARLGRRRRRVSLAQAYAYMGRKAVAGLLANVRFVMRLGWDGAAYAPYRIAGTRRRVSRL